ncbi:MAG: potassium channel family protein [Solirubrobacteraceae bacterium]
MLTALTGGAAFASVEKISVGDGIYWAITTMTTVGYGDFSPKTAEGKAIAVAVMLVGIGFATLLVGAIAERFIRPEVHEVEQTEEDLGGQVRDISARLQQLERSLQGRAAADRPRLLRLGGAQPRRTLRRRRSAGSSLRRYHTIQRARA